jgi:hypothetical protein
MQDELSDTLILHHHECSRVNTELEAAQQLYDFLKHYTLLNDSDNIQRPSDDNTIQALKNICLLNQPWFHTINIASIGQCAFNDSLQSYYQLHFFSKGYSTSLANFPYYNKNYTLCEPNTDSSITILGVTSSSKLAAYGETLPVKQGSYDTASAIQQYIAENCNSAKKIIIHHHDAQVVAELQNMQGTQVWEVKHVPKGQLVVEKPAPLKNKTALHAASSSSPAIVMPNETAPRRETIEIQIPLASDGAIAPSESSIIARHASDSASSSDSLPSDSALLSNSPSSGSALLSNSPPSGSALLSNSPPSGSALLSNSPPSGSALLSNSPPSGSASSSDSLPSDSALLSNSPPSGSALLSNSPPSGSALLSNSPPSGSALLSNSPPPTSTLLLRQSMLTSRNDLQGDHSLTEGALPTAQVSCISLLIQCGIMFAWKVLRSFFNISQTQSNINNHASIDSLHKKCP